MVKPNRQEPDVERLDRYRRAFRSRRRNKSRKRDAGFPWGEVVTAFLTGVSGYLAAPSVQQVWNVVVGIGSALAGILIWHFVLAPLGRYVWTVPEEEHVAQQLRIDEVDADVTRLEKERDGARTERDGAVRLSKSLQDQLSARNNEVGRLTERVAALESAGEFRIDIVHGGYYVAASKPGDHCVMPGVWLVYYDVVITNQTEKQLPLELWLMVGMRPDGSWRFGEAAQSAVGAWALEPVVEYSAPLDRLINLPALSATTGYCLTNLTHGVFNMAGVVNEKELVEQRPFWLEVKNKLTGESKTHAMNFIAERIDRGIPA